MTGEERRRTVEHNSKNRYLIGAITHEHTAMISLKVSKKVIKQIGPEKWLRIATLLYIAATVGGIGAAAIKNMTVIVSAGSKLSDVPLTELAKLSRGTQKNWSDGKAFSLIIKNPEAPEMRVAMQKLFGDGGDFKAAIAKVNESRIIVKIVGSDEELLRIVEATPGAVGIVDVYSINSSVKVLRVDGKLPFDAGYALKGN